MTVAAIVLSVVGALLELGGLAFVVRQIRGDRDLAERYLATTQEAPSFGGQTFPMKASAIYERERRRGSTDPKDQIRRAEENERDLERVRTAARRSAVAQREQFVAFIGDLLTGGLGQRRLGAVLIMLGIVFSVAANVVGALA